MMSSPAYNKTKGAYLSHRQDKWGRRRTIVPLEYRFWEKVERDPSGCWRFTGHVGQNGYGQIGTFGRSVDTAHRVAWQLHNQAELGALHVLHSCDTRWCVNPHHLRAGTHLQNMQDMDARGRRVNTPSPRLTDAEVREIRSLRGTEVSDNEIAQRYGITAQYVGQLARMEWRVPA